MPQKFLSIKNFEKYQSASKGTTRPWIKLYKSILGDPEFMKLSTHCRFLYTGLLLLADECGNKIYNDRTYLGQRLYVSHTEVDLKPLYRAGFLEASNLSRVLSEEIREELEERREEIEDVFELVVWKGYPRKVGKVAAKRAWDKLNGSRPPTDIIIKAIESQKQSEQWRKDNGKFIPHLSTWLNGKRWEDEVPPPARSIPKSMVDLL